MKFETISYLLENKEKGQIMNIYQIPKEVPTPTVDYSNFDLATVEADEKNHQEKLKQHLIAAGYDKPLTGEILREPIADGYAMYMVMDGGRQWGLIHLPYGDAYQSQNIQYLPKAEVKKRIIANKKIRELFS